MKWPTVGLWGGPSLQAAAVIAVAG
jgi:hypothetical protein